MALSTSLLTLSFLTSASAAQTITVTTPGRTDTVTAAMLDGSFASVSPASTAAVNYTATFTVTPTGTAPLSSGGDDGVVFTDGSNTVTIPVSVGGSPASVGILPPLQTLSNAVAYVRAITDAPTTPTDAQIAIFLDTAVEQIADEIEPVQKDIALPILAGVATVTLPYDVQDIIALRYSTSAPFVAGGQETEIQELGTLEFVDATAGMPQQGGFSNAGGSLFWFRRISDGENRIRLEFSPSLPSGYLRLNYFVRPILWSITTESTSVINVDTAYVRLAILFAAREVCLSRKDTTRATYFQQLYDAQLARKADKIQRRRRQRGSVVRDVTSQGGGSFPSYISS